MPLRGDARQKLDQMNRKKGKHETANKKNIKDLRQIIKKKTNTRDDRVASGRITKTKDSRVPIKRTTARKSTVSLNSAQETVKASWSRNAPHDNNSKRPQRQLYVPPHMKEPRVIVVNAGAAQPVSNLAMDNQIYRPQIQEQGASVLISNLIPTITQSEIIELFGDIGTLTGVNMINSTTALVSYQNSSDAVRAVKVYNNRSLDGKPMNVNMMPSSTTSIAPATNVRSRISHSSLGGRPISSSSSSRRQI